MKQTAVDWLCNEWLYIDHEFDMNLIDKKTYWERLKSVQEQAKAMEKEQKIAFGYRCIGEVDSELGDLIYKKVPEEIYNETFKTE